MKYAIALLLLLPAAFLIYRLSGKENSPGHITPQSSNNSVTRKLEEKAILLRLKEKARLISGYIRNRHFNNTHCFIMDLNFASGSNRFFVYNLKKDSLECEGLVAHGSGSDSENGLYFSNKTGSNCTSLGRFRIGKPYYGKFGLAYKLYGLDTSNSNAFNRFVVLHAHPCVPETPVKPLEICRSWGCPTVAPSFLLKLKTYIETSEQPVLLWITR